MWCALIFGLGLKLIDGTRSLEHLQIFDDASRGPWGALKFFLFARKATFIAYVGCIVTIAAIALDPFTQQILSYGQMSTQALGLRSSVTRSQAYDNQGKGLNGNSNVMSELASRYESTTQSTPASNAL